MKKPSMKYKWRYSNTVRYTKPCSSYVANIQFFVIFLPYRFNYICHVKLPVYEIHILQIL